MKTSHLLLISFLLLWLSCDKETSIKEPTDEPNNEQVNDQGNASWNEFILSEKSEDVIAASNTFGFDIFRLILADEPADKNLFISPTSISLALAMLLNGANSTTESSMSYAMRTSNLTMDQINATYKDLIDELTTVDEKVLLAIANSIWYRNGFSVEDDFLDINEVYYNAEIASLDFSSSQAVNIINNWCAENTNNRIQEVITEIDPLTMMFLLNAIYFKGAWTREFNPEYTYDDYFMLSDYTGKQVKTMLMEDTIMYSWNSLFRTCELNYGRGNYSMIILLPNAENSVEDIADQLTSENWDTMIAALDSQWVRLTLPKFTFSYEKDLNEILSEMGMAIAFSPEAANFSGLCLETPVFISLVKHNTFVEVNEEGTEAAAVTTEICDATEDDPNGPIKMFVNRPFLFAIREKSSKAVVFIGKVGDPIIEEPGR